MLTGNNYHLFSILSRAGATTAAIIIFEKNEMPPAFLCSFDTIEKAKGMLQLPEFVYKAGRAVTNGTAFGEGDYTEENLMACIQRFSDLDDLEVDGWHIVPERIGTKAYYTQ